MSYKLDIFRVLDNITQNHPEYVDKLSEEELKSVSPYVLQMWLKGADNNLDARMLLMNDTSNKYMFSLGEHKKLLFKLLCVANGFEINTRCHFKKNTQNQPTFVEKTIAKYYNCPLSHAKDAKHVLMLEEILEIGQALGYEKEDLDKLEKEQLKI